MWKAIAALAFLLALPVDAHAGFPFRVGATPPSGAATAITATDFADGEVINRAPGATGTQGRTITFTGAYVGNPVGFDVELLDWSSGAVVQTWTALGNFSASGGNWSGALSVPLSSDFLKFQVRDHTNNSVVSSVSVNQWGIGIDIGLFGQSNMENIWELGSKGGVAANDKIRAFTPSSWHLAYPVPGPWDNSNADDQTIAMMNAVQQGCNCLVGFAWFPISGTAISQWLTVANGGPAGSTNVWVNNVTLGGTGADSADRAGLTSPQLYDSDFEIALWQQGENDVGSSIATYLGKLNLLWGQFLSVTGRTSAQLRFGVVPLGTEVPQNGHPVAFPTFDPGVDNIRQAHLQFISDNAASGAFYGGTPLDAAHNPGTSTNFNFFTIHWDDADYAHVIHRYGQELLKHLGFALHGDGPKITAASIASGTNVLKLSIAQDGGTELVDSSGGTVGNGLQGFRVFDNGDQVAITGTAFNGPTEIDLTLASNVASGDTVAMDYGYGADPAGYNYANWTNLSAAQNATTLIDSAASGQFTSSLGGQTFSITGGTNFTAGDYTVSSVTDPNDLVLSAAPATSGAGSAGAGSVSVGTATLVYDNFIPLGLGNYDNSSGAWADTLGTPLQPTLGQITATVN